MKFSEETKTSVFALAFMLVFLGVIASIWYLFKKETNRSSSDIELRVRCTESGGSLIEGVTDTSGTVTHFIVCVPEEAFYCADIE